MTVRFYRLAVWLPLLVPAAVAVAYHGLGWRPEAAAGQKFVQLMLISLLYGGVPYALLAIWATWWVGGRTESEISRLMYRAPFLMAVFYFPFALVVGTVAGAPLGPLLAAGGLGAIVSLLLGFAYVALIVLLRHLVVRWTGGVVKLQ